LANNLTWAEQVEIGEVQSLFLSYVLLKEEMNDTMSIKPVVKSMHAPCTIEINDASASQGLEPLVILYITN